MRRLLASACALLVLAAVVAGVAVSSRLGPERLREEIVRRLGAELGPVQIDAVRPHFGWGVGIEIEGLRTVGASEAPELAADRVWITLSARSLLRGEPRARRIDVRGLRVRAEQRADGVWEPPALARILERWPAPPDAALPVPLPSAANDLRAIARGPARALGRGRRAGSSRAIVRIA